MPNIFAKTGFMYSDYPQALSLQLSSFEEYLLVALPDERVKEMIEDERRPFEAYFGREHALPPHIPVARMLFREQMEETVIRWIQNICRLQSQFEVTLNHYSGIPSHGIYLRVVDQSPFNKLSNALTILDGFFETNGCPPLMLPYKTVLTIAEGLPLPVYEELLTLFANKNFYESFRVSKLLMLRKNLSGPYRVVNSFVMPPSVPA